MTQEQAKEFEVELNALLEKYDARFNGNGGHCDQFIAGYCPVRLDYEWVKSFWFDGWAADICPIES